MKVLALLTPFIAADGELDPADYGYVVGCNNDSTGVVEMTVCLKEETRVCTLSSIILCLILIFMKVFRTKFYLLSESEFFN